MIRFLKEGEPMKWGINILSGITNGFVVYLVLGYTKGWKRHLAYRLRYRADAYGLKKFYFERLK